jgi:hypothetical protein
MLKQAHAMNTMTTTIKGAVIIWHPEKPETRLMPRRRPNRPRDLTAYNTGLVLSRSCAAREHSQLNTTIRMMRTLAEGVVRS